MKQDIRFMASELAGAVFIAACLTVVYAALWALWGG